MIKFSKDKVLRLHKLIAQETGGSIGAVTHVPVNDPTTGRGVFIEKWPTCVS